VARHTDRENPNAALAEIFPGLSADQTPPALSAELDSILFELFDG
jgi:hypothetical protein